MALDQEYFDSINIEVVKKKYYNANKVEAVFADIRRQAEALTEENALLRCRVEELSGRRSELSAAAYSAQEVYQIILEKANQQAEEIRTEAEETRRAAREEARQQSDYAVQLVERCLKRVREQQQASLDTLNAAWQSFLCGLPETEEPPREEAPADLSAKVDAIARALQGADE